MSLLQFYATKDDLIGVFEDLESRIRVFYFRYGLQPDPSMEMFSSGSLLPDLGSARGAATTTCDMYLVTADPGSIVRRQVGSNHFVDQLVNPDTITLNVGGLVSPTVLLSGSIGNTSSSTASRQLFAAWRSTMKKHWTRRQALLLGEGAERLLRNGGRLTSSIGSPPMYDLPSS